jgi:Mce-associated membrane protein
VAVVLALAAAALAGYLLLTRNDAEDARQAALAAARQYAVDLTTYDFASIDADFQRFARHGTTAFRASYANTIAASKPGIVKAQTRSLGTVVGAGVESYAEGKTIVLLAVDQELRSAARPGATVEHSRIRLTLVRSGDGWLVSAVTVL